MKRSLAIAFSLFFLGISGASHATITLVEKDDWKVLTSGFVEMDAFRDSRRSFTEVIANSPVDRPGTFSGENGRMQFSVRNSRLAFTFLPPQQGEWKSKGYLEFDLIGYDPAPSATTQSEGSFLTNPTFRMRHAYIDMQNNGWEVIAGQYWTLFGWEPTYVLTTASVPPAPGTVYQRTPQLTGMKTCAIGEQGKLQSGVSIARPSQRDSSMPNIDAGVKFSWAGLGSGFSSYVGDAKVEPMSVALSGTMRQFSTATSANVADGMTKSNGTAFAVNAMLPILPSSDGKDLSNTITVTGEFSSGKGYADAFPGWTGGLAQLPSGATGGASTSNIDAGQGGYDAGNSYQLVKLQSWNAEVQYHFPTEMHSFATAGYTQLSSSNINGLGPAKTSPLYDRTGLYFVNLFHDLTPQVRVAVEYAKVTTHYVDDVSASDDRYQISGYLRF